MRLPLELDDLVRGIEDDVPSGSALDRLHAAVEVAGQASALADRLVGHFVDAARGEGRSWAEIGAELGVSKQAAQQRFVGRPVDPLTAGLRPVPLVGGRTGRRGFFSRFTTEAREVISLAQDEARQLGHDAVRPDHLLLSVLHHPEGRPALALGALGIHAEVARRRIVDAIGSGAHASEGSPPFAPEAKRLLERALREGLRSEGRQVAVEHILLGALDEAGAPGAQLLVGLGANPDAVRRALRDLG
ncbi:MAG: Clp protease N-terminal domain-containing protein [Acidimicrobiia bacterium]